MNVRDVIRLYREELEGVQTFARVTITKRELGIAKMIAKFGRERVVEAMREVFGLYLSRGKVPDLGAILKHLNEGYVDNELRTRWMRYDVLEIVSGVGRYEFGGKYFYLLVDEKMKPWWLKFEVGDYLGFQFIGSAGVRYRYLTGFRYADYFVRKGCMLNYVVMDSFVYSVFGGEARFEGECKFERYSGLRYEYARDCKIVLSVYVGYMQGEVEVIEGEGLKVTSQLFGDDEIRGEIVNDSEKYMKMLWLRRALEAGHRVVVCNAKLQDYFNFIRYLKGTSLIFSYKINSMEVYSGYGVYYYDDMGLFDRFVRTCVRGLIPVVVFVGGDVSLRSFLKLNF